MEVRICSYILEVRNKSYDMKYFVILLFLAFISHEKKQEIDKSAEVILEAWIETQNKGTDKAIMAFIEEYYTPEVLSKMKNRSDHLKFYRQAVDEFGPIQKGIYEVMNSSKTKLKVQLLKVGTPLAPAPTPEEILVIEIDLDPNNTKYISRGLGMGALICYIKK